MPRIDKNALDALRRDPDIRKRMDKVARDILDESQLIVPVLGGDLKRSGFVDSDETTWRIGYTEDYATIVHEGTGVGKNAEPRHFLSDPAARNRGKV